MAESKMPAKIGVGQHTGWAAVHTATMKGDTVYIRADLVEPLVEALRRIADPRNIHFAGDAQVVAARALSSYEAGQ
jgi:hypothetical protein